MLIVLLQQLHHLVSKKEVLLNTKFPTSSISMTIVWEGLSVK